MSIYFFERCTLKDRTVVYNQRSLSDEPFLMAVTGSFMDAGRESELIGLYGTKCKKTLGEVPDVVRYATGNLVGTTTPVVCGGLEGRSQQRSICMKLVNNEWISFANMDKERISPASIATKDGKLWVTGGHDGFKSYLKTTEYITLDGKKESGPDLPNKRKGHCMSSIFNGDKTIIIGGEEGSYEYQSSTWIFDHRDETFDEMQPRMTQKRAFFGCSTFKSGHHSNRHVVVVAGGSCDNCGNTAEMLDYETQNAQWKSSKLFFQGIFWSIFGKMCFSANLWQSKKKRNFLQINLRFFFIYYGQCIVVLVEQKRICSLESSGVKQ